MLSHKEHTETGVFANSESDDDVVMEDNKGEAKPAEQKENVEALIHNHHLTKSMIVEINQIAKRLITIQDQSIESTYLSEP